MRSLGDSYEHIQIRAQAKLAGVETRLGREDLVFKGSWGWSCDRGHVAPSLRLAEGK
jgi:hypothetical protein